MTGLSSKVFLVRNSSVVSMKELFIFLLFYSLIFPPEQLACITISTICLFSYRI